jgi:hypothetical protein
MRENWGCVYFQCKFYFLFSSKFFFGKILEIKRKIEKRKKKKKKEKKGARCRGRIFWNPSKPIEDG